jgi:hypothetical protein
MKASLCLVLSLVGLHARSAQVCGRLLTTSLCESFMHPDHSHFFTALMARRLFSMGSATLTVGG